MATTDLFLASSAGIALVDGAMNNLFGDATVGDPIAYAFFEVRCGSGAGGSFTGGKLWLTIDAGGGALAIAVAAGAQAITTAWSLPSAASLTYSSPASSGSGLTIPTLTPGQKALFCARRDCTSASPARPEVNRLNIVGTAPIGF